MDKHGSASLDIRNISYHSSPINFNQLKGETLYITWIEAIGSYLLLKGHYDVQNLSKIPLYLDKLLNECFVIDPSWSTECKVNLLLPATICIYKGENIAGNKDVKCARARILNVVEPTLKIDTNLTSTSEVEVEIELIDYGNHLKVGCDQLFFPQNPEQLQNISYTLTNNVLLGVCDEWQESQLELIREIFCNYNVPTYVIEEYFQYKFVTMKWNHFDFTEYLIMQEKLGFHISNDVMLDDFKTRVQQLNNSYQEEEKIKPTKLENKDDCKNISNNLKNSKVIKTNCKNTINLVADNTNNRKPPIISNISDNISPLFPHLPRSDPKYLSKRLQCLQISGQYQKPMSPSSISVSVAASTPPSTAAQSLSSSFKSDNQLSKEIFIEPKQNQNQVMSSRIPSVPRSILTSTNPFNIQSRLTKYTAASKATPHYPTVQTVGSTDSMMKTVSHPHIADNGVVATNIQNGTAFHGNINKNFKQIKCDIEQPINIQKHDKVENSHIENVESSKLVNNENVKNQQSLCNNRKSYETTILTVNQVYDFHICFVKNGPYLFCGQLVSRLDELSEMMKKIEEITTLQQLQTKPVVGTPCIARYVQDSNLYRALIVSVSDNYCKVLYVDYGNADIVQYNDLYELPLEFLNYKIFAIRFTLSDLKILGTIIDESLMKIFSDLIIYRKCKLRIMPSEGGSSSTYLQYCQLFINDKNVLDLVKEIQVTRLVYIKAEPLQNDDEIEIRYIDTPQKFFVQKVKNITEFHNLMDDMYEYYTRHQNIPKNVLSIGTPCVVETDREWYRAIVKEVYKDTGKVLVHHVDFGYEETVTKDRMSTIAIQHLKLPEQAIQCCLKGYEGRKEISENCTTRLEMMAQDRNEKRNIFSVKVFRIQPDGVNLVNLFTNKLDVMKRLQMLSVSYNQYLQLERNNFNVESSNVVRNKHVSRKTVSMLNESVTASSNTKNLKNNSNNSEQQKHEQTVLKINDVSTLEDTKENIVNLEEQHQLQYTLPKYQQERLNRQSQEEKTNTSEETDQKHQLNQQLAMLTSSNTMQKFSKRNKRKLTSNLIETEKINCVETKSLSSESETNSNSSKTAKVLSEVCIAKTVSVSSTDSSLQSSLKAILPDESNLNNNQTIIENSKTNSDSTKINNKIITTTSEKLGEMEMNEYKNAEIDRMYSSTESETERNINCNRKRLRGYLAHCHNPAQFYIHPIERIRELKKLQENLQIVATSLPPLMRVVKGSQCISMYSVDKQWYRSKILDDELMVIQFIDYGNTDCVNDSTGLKEMIVFPDLAPFCIPCSLPIAPSIGKDWVDAANSIFNLSFCKVLEYEYITTNVKHDNEYSNPKKRNYINLYIDNMNVADFLIRDGYAKRLQLIETGTKGFISHIISINDFYMQCEGRVKCLEMIEMHLNEKHLNNSNLSQQLITEHDAVIGKIVAALYIEDSTWYRAKILKKIPLPTSSDFEDSMLTASRSSTCNFEVFFIDYGNTSICSNCREISEELANIPALAQRCAIELPDTYENWSDDAENRFFDLGINSEMMFTVVLCEPAIDRVYINLLYNNYNISDELLRLCKKKFSEEDSECTISDSSGRICRPLKENCRYNGNILNSSIDSSTATSIIEHDLLASQMLSNAVVTYINSINDFYIQTSEDNFQLNEIEDYLKMYVENTAILKTLQPELNQNYCYYNKDKKTYCRVKIIEKCDQLEPYYRALSIDYGFEIKTNSKSYFYILDDKMLSYKALAQQCRLYCGEDIVNEYGQVSNNYFQKLIDSYFGLVKVKNVKKSISYDEKEQCLSSSSFSSPTPSISTASQLVVELFVGDEQYNIIDLLRNQLKQHANKDKISVSEYDDEINCNNNNNNIKTCIISYANSPNDFYLQMQHNLHHLNIIKRTLQDINVIENLKSIEGINIGDLCCVYSEKDDCFHRGRVIEKNIQSENEKNGKDMIVYKIFLIDYGKHLNVNLDNNNLKELPETLKKIPELAKHCALESLTAKINSNMNKDQIREVFRTLIECHFGEIFEILKERKIDNEEGKVSVKLRVGYKDLLEELLDKLQIYNNDSPEKAFSPVPIVYDCSVIHVNSSQSFYVQLHKDIDNLKRIINTLLDYNENNKLIEFTTQHTATVGAKCVALFPDDGAFYRAIILKIYDNEDVKKYEVIYIDFGNTSITDQIYQIPEQLRDEEAYSYHCSFGDSETAIAISSKFMSFIDEHFTETFKLEMLVSSATATSSSSPMALNVVRLYYREKDLLNILSTGNII